MSEQPIVDVGQVIEGQKIGSFVIRLVLVSWVITFWDGFDMNVISYVAPYLTTEFGISRVALGNLFSIGIFGTMIGGFFFGYLGDRIGRRPAILIAAISFAMLTFAFGFAPSYSALMTLRFLNGIAIGGLLPLTWALNIEYVPRRFRATVVTLVMLGYTIGGAVGAPVTIWLAPRYGWGAVYWLAGVCTLAAAALLAATLPESSRYLAGKGRRPDLIARYLGRIAPGVAIPAGARFVIADEARPAGSRQGIGVLFERELAWITPLLWLAYIASSMAIFFKANWTPLVLEILGYTRSQAATFSSISAVGSALGGLVLMRFIDTKGPIAIAAMALIGIPLLLYAGLGDLGFWGFLVANFFVNIVMGGAHVGMHSISGIFYPSVYRASGAGWATSVAKIGSVAGPIIGGLILATAFPVRHIYALLAVSPAVVALAILFMSRIYRRMEGRVPAVHPIPGTAQEAA
jgi:AAHS family 4-hydroxybenzoate transporter-like MFS transporter